MQFFETTVYITSTSICLILAIVLLTLGTKQTATQNPYNQIKRMLAYSALLDMTTNISIIYCIHHQIDFLILDSFFTPSIYYLELLIMSYAMFRLIRSKLANKRNAKIMILPLLLFVAIYGIAYYIYSGSNFFSMGSYQLFVITPIAETLSKAIGLGVFVEFLLCVFALAKEADKYSRKVTNIYSGKAAVNGKKLSYLVYCFIGFFALAGINFLWDNKVANIAFIILTTIIFCIAAIIINNLQKVYQQTGELNDYQASQGRGANSASTQYAQIASNRVYVSLNRIISEWVVDSPKSYLYHDITLHQVADELNIDPQQLSDFLNSVYQMSFNT